MPAELICNCTVFWSSQSLYDIPNIRTELFYITPRTIPPNPTLLPVSHPLAHRPGQTRHPALLAVIPGQLDPESDGQLGKLSDMVKREFLVVRRIAGGVDELVRVGKGRFYVYREGEFGASVIRSGDE